jgi:protein required for attachment to host cells
VGIRIVVADQGEARFYDLERRDAPLRRVGRLNDPAAHLHDRDFKSDRPGRVFDRAPRAGERRGATAHHGTGGERRPRKHEAELFARRIAARLDQDRQRRRFDSVVLVAGSPFLGMLRAALPKPVKALVAATVARDLVHQPESVLREHLPSSARARSARRTAVQAD